MGQDLKRLEALYDQVAQEYAETFAGEHEKKPKDRYKSATRLANAAGRILFTGHL